MSLLENQGAGIKYNFKKVNEGNTHTDICFYDNRQNNIFLDVSFICFRQRYIDL